MFEVSSVSEHNRCCSWWIINPLQPFEKLISNFIPCGWSLWNEWVWVGMDRNWLHVTVKWNCILLYMFRCFWLPAAATVMSVGQSSGISFSLNSELLWCVCSCVYCRVKSEMSCSLLHDLSLQFVVSHLSCLVDVFCSCRLLLAFSIHLVTRYSIQHAPLNCTKPSALASLDNTAAPPA